MAKFELKFLDATADCDSIEVYKLKETDLIEIKILINGCDDGSIIYLDKSTAIKFAKTLRTEINKITESEVNNGK